MSVIDKIIEGINELPTIPTVVATALEITSRDDVSSSKLGEIIAKDQSLTSKLLKITNSSFYGLSNKVSNLTHAITLLGFSEIRNIVLMTSVFSSFDNEDGGLSWDREQFWGHSFLCGLAGKVLFNSSHYSFQSQLESIEGNIDFYVAGLIHDLGKLVLDRYSPSDFKKILELVDMQGLTMEEAETEVVGISHAYIGSKLLIKWNFPDALINAVKYHHNPWRAETSLYQRISGIIYVAEGLCKMAGMPSFSKEPEIIIHKFLDLKQKEFFKSIGLNLEDEMLDSFVSRLAEKSKACKDLQSMLSMK